MSNSFNQVIVKTRLTEIHHLEDMGLTLEDAEDIFQEASVVLYDVMSSQRLTMKSSPEAYLHGICQNMAYKRMEELKRLAGSVDDDKLNRLLALTDEYDDDRPDAIEEEDNQEYSENDDDNGVTARKEGDYYIPDLYLEKENYNLPFTINYGLNYYLVVKLRIV